MESYMESLTGTETENHMEDKTETSAGTMNTARRYPCHCCHKKASVYWSGKRRCFICESCLKTFDPAVIARRNDTMVEQLTLC